MVALTKDTLAEIGQLALKMRNHPKTRKEFARMAKEVVPTLTFPDVDQEDRVENMISDFKKEQEDNAAKAARTALETRLATEKNALAERYTPEQIAEIEKIMLDRGLASYADAAILYAHFNPPTQVNHNPRPQTSFELPTNKDWLTNPKKMALNTAYEAIDDIMRHRRTA